MKPFSLRSDAAGTIHLLYRGAETGRKFKDFMTAWYECNDKNKAAARGELKELDKEQREP